MEQSLLLNGGSPFSGKNDFESLTKTTGLLQTKLPQAPTISEKDVQDNLSEIDLTLKNDSGSSVDEEDNYQHSHMVHEVKAQNETEEGHVFNRGFTIGNENGIELSKENNTNAMNMASLTNGFNEGDQKEEVPAIKKIPETPKEELKQGLSSPSKSKNASELIWEDKELSSFSLHYMDVFRKSKQFCDLILKVGGNEVYCHRVVVGGVSTAIYDELMQGEQDSGPIARITVGNIRSPLNPEAVDLLVDYMYTSKLTIPAGLLTAVYRSSVALGIDRVTPYCRKEIINQFDVSICVSMRRLALTVGDKVLLKLVDEYIEENFDAVTRTNEFLLLPRIKMEVGTSQSSHCPVIPRDFTLCQLVLLWIREEISKHNGHYIEELTEQVQRITLDDLQNITPNLKEQRVSVGSANQDFSTFLNHTHCRMSRSSSMDSLSSVSSNESADQCQPDGMWGVLSHSQNGDHVILLCCLGGVMASVSLHIQVHNGANGTYQSNSVTSSASSSTHSCTSSVGSISDLSHLSQARCAAGVASINGKIFAFGGYNQSECLDTIECFDPSTNRWCNLARMPEKRARFGAGVLRGQVYAVGGSTGSHDQSSVNIYDCATDKWTKAPSLPTCLSGAGVVVLDDLLYCVGGMQQSHGIGAIKFCYVFDPKQQQWSKISSLNTGRNFAGVAAHRGSLYCAGGTDGWVCLATVEKYDLEHNRWTRAPSLNSARKGAGLASHANMLYCAGGSNGSSFLSSVEQLSVEHDMWITLNTTLTIPRSNVGLVSANSTLYAVGGYSGRNFLSSIEALDDHSEVWSTNDTSSVALPTTPEVNGGINHFADHISDNEQS